jgi:hypothetical protein
VTGHVGVSMTFLLRNLKEKDYLENLVVDGRILKWTLNGM